MIRYYCDVCKRSIDPEQEMRYVVNVQVVATFDPALRAQAEEEDRDYIEEMNEILDAIDEVDEDLQQLGSELHQEMRFDLCEHCRREFLDDPLGRGIKKRLKFSPN